MVKWLSHTGIIHRGHQQDGRVVIVHERVDGQLGINVHRRIDGIGDIDDPSVPVRILAGDGIGGRA
jgi:hypothetical protein